MPTYKIADGPSTVIDTAYEAAKCGSHDLRQKWTNVNWTLKKVLYTTHAALDSTHWWLIMMKDNDI